ncbi:uncharacterized protein BO80DRAFT_461742 [Aspergillus ibericus CBS 121593]|uniref:RING-type domain-containing protein n=1 Tax=Aspergillus ibericus CBS 121593 TaxID=1448316 RepID=A0A395HC07_9EURO|nr:hypothetical protein BO80DRAFT_461742 [Aspergillus ibericus CBS 121593]RAL04675.1 hypothetical protein BO80DRAFT_461742 [Aspergillus ibericus CBS 121593]
MEESEPQPTGDPDRPQVPDKTLQLQVLLILCLGIYIVTAICLLLKSYCIAYGTLDFTSTPATTPDQPPPWDSSQRLKSLNRVAPLKRYDTWHSSSLYNERSPLLADDGELSICAICLDPVHREDIIHALACKHVFHGRCLETWFLEYHDACPVCWRVFFV